MNADYNELDRLAYAQATDTLDAQDQALLDALGPDNTEFMQRLDYWQNHIAGLDLAAGEVIPPAQVWNNIESSVRAEAEKEAALKPPPRYWWQTLAVAASITLFGLVVFWQSAPKVTSINLENQWLVQVSEGPNLLTIAAQNPMSVPAGKVCNLWFKTGDTVVGIAQMPVEGNIVLDLKNNPQLNALLNQPGTMMITVDDADAGLEVMKNQSVLNGQWL